MRDLSGQRFGRLVAVDCISNTGPDGRSRVYWRCVCDCGLSSSVESSSLTRGVTSSCGCARSEALAARSTTHGAKRGYRETPEHKAWTHAKGRCLNPKDAKYPIYGGRGIRMCEEWRSDFAAFLAYMGNRPAGKTLDRINVNGHYEPGNCRWATPKEQAANTRFEMKGCKKGFPILKPEYR